MPIEFKVRTDDLKRAAKQLQVNRGEFKDADFVDIVVSTCSAELKSVGTETTIVADGRQTGRSRIPLRMLARLVDAARSYHTKECMILVDNGFASVGRTKVSHPDISVGIQVCEAISIPTNASVLDILAVATRMSPADLANGGLLERVEAAQKRASSAIETASGALEDFGISSDDITDLVDRRVAEVAVAIKTNLTAKG